MQKSYQVANMIYSDRIFNAIVSKANRLDDCKSHIFQFANVGSPKSNQQQKKHRAPGTAWFFPPSFQYPASKWFFLSRPVLGRFEWNENAVNFAISMWMWTNSVECKIVWQSKLFLEKSRFVFVTYWSWKKTVARHKTKSCEWKRAWKRERDRWRGG